MANTPQQAVENNFVGGLNTDASGLNFPENACSDADNTVFSITGRVDRRLGMDYETNFQLNTVNSLSSAINTYKWNNVAGDGLTQIVVNQIGGTLYFYVSSASNITSPLSSQLLNSTVNISTFTALGGSFDPTIECEFTDGNGYLFGFHPNCDPFYCTYNSGSQTITATVITVQIRDFLGVNDGLALGTRPPTLSPEHNYNLVNQGWSGGFTATSNSTVTIANAGTSTFQLVAPFSNLPIVVGMNMEADAHLGGITTGIQTGTVFSWDPGSGILVLTNSATGNTSVGSLFSNWTITTSPAYINQWYNVLKVYPSNSDVWWYFRNTNVANVTGTSADGQFAPQLAKTGYIISTNSQAPQGSMILNAFYQQRSLVSFVLGITDITTTARPSNGAFFQGRVFYTGVSASQQPIGDAAYYTWTESIYFSQVIKQPQQFGYCYQQNDPTSSTLFDLLPDDGGVIVIQGSGTIYKLFVVQNGLLVFAANGIWFITGSQGIGFSATDYTITKISGIQSISRSSYVNVLGWPIFWNEEGVYHVQPSTQGGGLTVNNLCLGRILSFYNNIPLQSKLYARGDYNPITYVVQWIYRSTNETDVTSRYQFDRMLNLNTYKAPFYPYTIANATGYPWISGINYVAGPGGSTSPEPTFKYFTVSNSNTQTTFSEEKDSINWKDWDSVAGLLPIDYTSTFTTGYKLHGQATRLWQLGYIWMYSENTEQTAYKIRGLWDYGTSGTSGKWSVGQVINNNIPNFSNVARKIKIRGHGLALQLQVTSISGMPFDFIGWGMFDWVNQGI